MICFLPHCVSFNHVTSLQSFLKESRLFFPAQAEYSYFAAVRLNNILVNIIMKSSIFIHQFLIIKQESPKVDF